VLKDLDSAADLADRYGVNVEDVLLIALNAAGVHSPLPHARARVKLRLTSQPDRQLLQIPAFGREESPFECTPEEIKLGGETIAEVDSLEADDIVLSYFRNDGRVLNLNSNARSQCTGCVFCYTTLEDAHDARLQAMDDISAYIGLLAERLEWEDLNGIDAVTLSTGCFHQEWAALEHLAALRDVLGDYAGEPTIQILSSVIRTADGFDDALERIAPFYLTLTVECFSKRPLLLKRSKADLDREQMHEVLSAARERGFQADFTYIVGLDEPEVMLRELGPLAEHCSSFPMLQIFQAHNDYMRRYAAPGADTLEFFLEMRRELEDLLGPTGMRPKLWQNYRPLWYFTFAGEPLEGAAI
jgi:hypothetical protein